MAVLEPITLELVLRPAGTPRAPGSNETVVGTVTVELPAMSVSVSPDAGA